jgi:superfamily II DNA or RNA helicase
LQPGKLVTLRGRDWVVLPSDDPDLLVIRPLGGSDHEATAVYLPLEIEHDRPRDARFAPPTAEDLGDIATAKLLHDSSRLAFRNGAGPFRALAKLSFRPRSYQLVPLIMGLRQDRIRLLIADDVGVGKTVEALLLARELMERRRIERFAVICLPHLCDQWQREIRRKLDIEAVIIRSSTQARLDRQIHGDTSVYHHYPYQIISIDYIKAEGRRDVFVQECPELVIVDEAHACARPAGASLGQQQRYHLLRRLSDKPGQQLILLTATPHSGKPTEFQSLLGLLKPEFESLDPPTSSQAQRKDLAKHFIQRKRADIEKWLGEDTPFPDREPSEQEYRLSKEYGQIFEALLDFARKLVEPDPRRPEKQRRARYWTALGLLRGAMSSPDAGIAMLSARLANLPGAAAEAAALPAAHAGDESPGENPVGDSEDLAAIDTVPTQLVEARDWSEHQRRQLRSFRARLEELSGPGHDVKLDSLAGLLTTWLAEGFHAIVFCKYIQTANYLGRHLPILLRKRFPKVDVQVATSEDPDDVRKKRIDDMESSTHRILVATDCLSEGIDLQQFFTAVVHYDLPWNPNRLEQREGRVDRFGQTADIVKACLLYGIDNPIDGIVLDVLLRKVREIKRATGINVPFPDDSQSIIDAITTALLLNPDRKISMRQDNQQTAFDFSDFGEAAEAKGALSRKLDEATAREKLSRSIFAQNAIDASEIEQDLKAVDEAIGNPAAVEAFVTGVLRNVYGVQVIKDREAKGYSIVTDNLALQLREVLPPGARVKVTFESPEPKGYHYVGRNHRFVELLCHSLMANTLARQDRRAARAAVIRTRDVETKTTLLLFRCRNVIEQAREKHKTPLQVIAEEMLLWGWSGAEGNRRFLDHTEAKRLLESARASSDLSPQSRVNFLGHELAALPALEESFNRIAEEQSKRLVAAHERFSALMDKQRYQVVYPVLPMDLLGIYVLLPEVAPAGGKP